ncbi:MAG: hypothetical protein J6K41_00675 [Paraprevotella sp.]|nr:hypothetical protein [Paraprevotella sp.]
MNTNMNMQTFTLQIPESDMRFFSALAKKMGWKKKKVQEARRKTGLDMALEDVERGDLKSFNSVEALMDYLHS